MPKRTDIKKILLIGSGPIIISQACEFDYSGTQACKALREEGYEVVLINSNPATIMTDPEMADRTYVEPITPEAVEKIIIRERPDALLPTLGGQTGLNTAVALAESGVLEKYGVEMIGASLPVIHKAEDREKFRHAIEKIGLRMPRSGFARNMTEVLKIAGDIGFPIIIRASFTLGGTGSGVAYNREELMDIAKAGLDASMISEVMIEESVLGWKEYELEVMRDKADNVVIICSIENFDAMGVHTGESITVAPAQTLTDQEYQVMRDAAIAIMREIGVETGGSNVQFAIHPQTGEMIVVEMNPRVSRSSALASKATGFPIAKIAAKLAVGYTLDEIPNDITRETMASFEPTIDYVVTKIPRWTFEKFPETEDFLTTSMKSVGETMAIGRTFKESLQKAIRSLEIGRFGFGEALPADSEERKTLLQSKLVKPNSLRLFYIGAALASGMTVDNVYDITKIDPWFLHQIKDILDAEEELKTSEPTAELLRAAKEMGFSDRALSRLWNRTEQEIRDWRTKENILPVYKLVDTCAAEFEAYTPYFYSTYETENESRPSHKKKVAIIGGGPNRIGQGIEFDYCCVHASFALREEGIESIMINSNPETVSTDYDTSDKLFFEPVTLEDVLHIIQTEKPDGVIVQFGGQTPLNLARGLEAAGVPIIGTSPTAIDRAENRDRFQEIVNKLQLNQPDNDTAMDVEKALVAAGRIGYPVLVRPSYVLGGRSMEIVYDPETLRSFMAKALLVSPGHPILIDKFLEDAVEVDVDALSDGTTTVVAGIMEHIEEAGIHSGDSACILPSLSISAPILELIEKQTKMLAAELGVVGLMNIQYAIKDNVLYVLEVNPRASRTVPFVSKAIGVPLAKLATKVMLGKSLQELGFTQTIIPRHVSVKEAVFPFNRFPEVDILLGPEMKSTGEVMGIDQSFGVAFAKSQMAAGFKMPKSGTIFISVHDYHKDRIVDVARSFSNMGFKILATAGTANHLKGQGIEATIVNKVSEGRPHIVDYIKNGDIQMVINTSVGRKSSRDAYHIRRGALTYNVLYTTTLAGARALCEASKAIIEKDWGVCPLQEYYKQQGTDIREKYMISEFEDTQNESGRPREECGVFAIYGHEDASRVTYFGLFALQHRGQESAGIVASDGCNVSEYKGMGLASSVFKESILQKLPGSLAIGHVRYSTTGSSTISNAQPFLVHVGDDYYALAHNGNIVNAQPLRAELENRGSIFQSTMDSEVIIHLMAPHLKRGLEKALSIALSQVEGAYSLVMLTRDKIIAARDPRGFRPLALGRLNGGWVIASETCAFDLVGAEYIRDVEPGEIIIIDAQGEKSIKPFAPAKHCHCVFEMIYFARPDSQVFGRNVYLCRKQLGRELAREYRPDADIVMPFPDSGNYAALGYAEESGIPFEMGMIRNHYIGRTFIQPTQPMRDFAVRVKLNPVKPLLKGKKVIIVEDSIIRGTTSRNRVKNLREIGIDELHMVISCPPTLFPCPYGIDFSSKGELIATKKENEKAIAEFIGLDSLHYLTVDGMIRATGMPKECFCLACYTGDYPIIPPEKIDKFCMEVK